MTRLRENYRAVRHGFIIIYIVCAVCTTFENDLGYRETEIGFLSIRETYTYNNTIPATAVDREKNVYVNIIPWSNYTDLCLEVVIRSSCTR